MVMIWTGVMVMVTMVMVMKLIGWVILCTVYTLYIAMASDNQEPARAII